MRALRLFFGLSVCLSVCLSSLYLCIDVWVFAIFSPVFVPLHSKPGGCYRDCAVHVENHHCTRSHAERAGDRGGGRAIQFEREIWAQTHTNRDAQTDRKTRTHTYTRARAHTHTHTQVSAIKVSRKEKREILGLYPCTAPASYVLPSRVALVREAEVREAAAASSPG